MTFLVEDIENQPYTSRPEIMNMTPTQLCQAVVNTKSFSENDVLNSIINKNPCHSSRTNLYSLTNVSPSEDRRLVFQTLRMTIQRVKENISSKEGFQKMMQMFHKTKEAVLGKAVQILRVVNKKTDTLCIQEQGYRTVILVLVKGKNVSNDQRNVIEVKPITYNEDDKNSAFYHKDETCERLDDKWPIEKELENEKEREILSDLKGDMVKKRHEHTSVFDQTEFTFPDELYPLTWQMSDNKEEPLKVEFENCDENFSGTMEENEILERERMYEVMGNLSDEENALQNGSRGILVIEGKVKGLECSGLMRPEVEVDVVQTEHNPSGIMSGRDDSDLEVARESVKGKKTAKKMNDKMDAIEERWEEQTKESSRKLIREQIFKTELLEDKSMKEYGRNVPNSEGKYYGRNEGEIERAGSYKGIDQTEDKNGDSTLVKYNGKGVNIAEVKSPGMRSYKDTRQEQEQEKLQEEEQEKLQEEEQEKLQAGAQEKLQEGEHEQLQEEEQDKLQEKEQEKLQEGEEETQQEEQKDELQEREQDKLQEKEKEKQQEEGKEKQLEEERETQQEEKQEKQQIEEKEKLREGEEDKLQNKDQEKLQEEMKEKLREEKQDKLQKEEQEKFQEKEQEKFQEGEEKTQQEEEKDKLQEGEQDTLQKDEQDKLQELEQETQQEGEQEKLQEGEKDKLQEEEQEKLQEGEEEKQLEAMCQCCSPLCGSLENRSGRGKMKKPKKRPKDYINREAKDMKTAMLPMLRECILLLLQVCISMCRQYLSRKDTQCWKSTSVRKPRPTGDDVHKCELGVGMLLDNAGDSDETIRNKNQIIYEMKNNPNNRKVLYRLASRYLLGWRDHELQQLMTGDDSPEKVIREFKHQGLTIGHLVKYYNEDFTCRDDILCLIDKIHPTCVYCCPSKTC